MRRLLNAIYEGAGFLAGVFLILIGVLSIAQVAGRLLGIAAYSFDDFAGFAMAASSFLALAHTFRRNEHIRVSLFIERLTGRARAFTEIVITALALFLVGYFTWYSADMTIMSYQLHDMSTGLVALPLWIPQTGMTLGLLVLFIALVDDLVTALAGHVPSYLEAERTRQVALSESL